MPMKPGIGERLLALSVLVIMACGLLILMVALFHLDQGAYQLLAVLGLNSVILGYLVLRQRWEIIKLQQALKATDPTKLRELFNEAKALYDKVQQSQEAN